MFAFLFCAIVPDYLKTHTVDVVEVNHVCAVSVNDDGTHQITRHISQVIFWELASTGEFRVVDWRMLKDCNKPQYDHARRVWVTRWLDRGLFGREVIALSQLEPFTLHDPEVEDRKLWRMVQRRTFGKGQR